VRNHANTNTGEKPVVLALLPHAGLGNVLFVWAKAMLFSRMHNLPLHTSGWNKVKLGPWLRGDRSKRFYGNSFRRDTPRLQRLLIKPKSRFMPEKRKLCNPPLSQHEAGELLPYSQVIFSTLPYWSDFFKGIKEHREIVKQELYGILVPSMRERLFSCAPPVLGVHVRLGDFRNLAPHEQFKDAGGVRTPQEYFIKMIKRIREIKGEEVPAMIFTDGHPPEISQILALPNVSLAPTNPDIVDLLLLSRSKLVITSAGSTFGYWAGFLSEAPLIMHPEHIHGSIRSAHFNQNYYEGALTEPFPELLIHNVLNI
jgi:hypothetical protein